jgi:predicted RNase H-like nuclease
VTGGPGAGRTLGGRVAVGLDGCRVGWVAVTLVDEIVADVRVVASLDALELDAGAVVGVDMPVGAVDGWRAADRAARQVLPGRASSIFAAPPRAVVEAWRAGTLPDHAAATALSRQVTGQGLSMQAWRLVPRIVEAGALADRHAAVLEVHPEVAFAVLEGRPLPSKRTWAGHRTREAVLTRLGMQLPAAFDGADRVAADDVVDAAICAWVAAGPAAQLRTFPEAPTEHDRGRPIVIHARRPLPPGG